MDNKNERGFSSNIGAIIAAAGGAVGLGNIWRFPYVVGQNGGAAFLLMYVLFILLLGIPVMLSEIIIGRRSQRNLVGAFRTLAPKHKAMDDKESRNEFVIFVVTAELGTWDQCQQFFSDYSKRHPGLFKEYEKDMTVGEARGHILLFWTSDKGWTKDIKPFGSLLIEGDDFSSGESGTSKDGGIYRLTDEGYCDWVNPINSLWVNKGAAITVENNGQAQGAAARRVDDVLRHFNEFTKESESGKDTWSVTHLDDVMWWPMPGIAKSMLGPFSEILSHYPDAAWSTRMINDVLIDRLHDIYYKGRKSSTGGIVYFNFAAVRNTYGPQRVIIPVDVYGRSAVAYTLSMNGPCHIN